MRRPDPDRAARRATGAAALFLLLALGAADAEIYRCVGSQGTSFRDKPCPGSEKQTRLGPAQAPWVGCYQVDDSGLWAGGSGSWVVRIDSVDGIYYLARLTEMREGQPVKSENVDLPMHRATVDEMATIGAVLGLKVTSGLVLELPDDSKRILGAFNAWDDTGALRSVAYFAFVNGFSRKVACP